MFSGIIERLGHVHAIIPGASGDPGASGSEDIRLELKTGFRDLDLGESVAVNGVCLTVTEFDAEGTAAFFVSPETLAVTSLGRLRAGAAVNLERAVMPSTRLSGHIVQGHVDGMARLLSAIPDGEAWVVRFSLPGRLRRYCVTKGSITLDGISLTLNEVGEIGAEIGPEDQFAVALMIIPHTWTHTTLGALAPGEAVNVEVDVIAKYVEQLYRNPS